MDICLQARSPSCIDSSIFSSVLFSHRVSHWSRSLLVWIDGLSRKPQGPSCSPSSVGSQMYHGKWKSLGIWMQVLMLHNRGFTTGPSPQPKIQVSFRWLFFWCLVVCWFMSCDCFSEGTVASFSLGSFTMLLIFYCCMEGACGLGFFMCNVIKSVISVSCLSLF